MNKNMKAIWCPDHTFYFKDDKYGIEELGVVTFYGKAAELDGNFQQALANKMLELIQFFVENSSNIASFIDKNRTIDLEQAIDLAKIAKEGPEKRRLRESLFNGS